MSSRGHGYGGQGPRGQGSGNRGNRGRGSGERGRGMHSSGSGRGAGGQSYRGQSPGDRRGSFSGAVYSSEKGLPVPDANVKKIEDALLGSVNSRMASLNLNTSWPTRPGYGSKGNRLVLWANYFAMKPPPNLVLYQYSLAVTPTTGTSRPTGKMLAHIISLFLEQPDTKNLARDSVTDFKSTLITKTKITNEKGYNAFFYRSEKEDEPLQNAIKYKVTPTLVKTLFVDDLMRYLSSSDLNDQQIDTATVIQGLNILVNHYTKSSSNIATIGSSKNFQLRGDKKELYPGLEAIRGYFTSVRAATDRILLNVNVASSAFYKTGALDKIIDQFVNSNEGQHDKLELFLRKLRVDVTHINRKNRKSERIPRPKCIFGLAHTDDGAGTHRPRVKLFGAGSKDVEFWYEPSAAGPSVRPVLAAAGYISVFNYFQKAHKITLRFPSMPVINVGTKQKPSYLPPEVCEVVAGQPMRRPLGGFQTSEMIKFAVRSPIQNVQSIMNNGLKKNFGVVVDDELIAVEGRVLLEPKVVYRSNQQASSTGGSWNMVPRGAPGMTFCHGAQMPKWQVLFITPKQGLETVLQSSGLIVGRPAEPDAIGMTGMFDDALDRWFQNAAARGIKLLFVVLPETQISMYYYVKQLGDIKYGIHTVCSVGSKIAGMSDQYLRNEALKVNLKLGGGNHQVQPSDLGLLDENKTMVVGIDVTHPSPGSADTAPSIAAMVASVNHKLGQWPGTLQVQNRRRQEMVTALTEMLKSRLNLWREKGKHDRFPENILIYRDGVSEGQYDEVLKTEVPQLRRACEERYSKQERDAGLPRMTVVIVGKRHHTRFYVTKDNDADQSGNSRPGTVVDRGVTQARHWDFFLQSHAAIKGTARPAHYFVLVDEIFRKRYGSDKSTNVADELQKVTQSLCYLFGRATKAVSYCTPAYYADILCERARSYLHKQFEAEPGDVPAKETAGTPEEQERRRNEGFQRALEIHPALKDTMFYI
ncbi:ribonuclease H-like domain-containing protein [Nemania abortiva]|nr:ribonuclease H-like domain-containing protein [Nemania abortiva]